MDKLNHLKEWASGIQKNIWERDVLIAMKKEVNAEQKDLDVLNMNNEKDQALVDFIYKYISESNS